MPQRKARGKTGSNWRPRSHPRGKANNNLSGKAHSKTRCNIIQVCSCLCVQVYWQHHAAKPTAAPEGRAGLHLMCTCTTCCTLVLSQTAAHYVTHMRAARNACCCTYILNLALPPPPFRLALNAACVLLFCPLPLPSGGP
jgi:hypothetical protein